MRSGLRLHVLRFLPRSRPPVDGKRFGRRDRSVRGHERQSLLAASTTASGAALARAELHEACTVAADLGS